MLIVAGLNSPHSASSKSPQPDGSATSVSVTFVTTAWNVAVILASAVTVAGTSHQLTNSQPSAAVAVIVVAVAHVQNVIVFSLTVIAVQYVVVTLAALTVP